MIIDFVIPNPQQRIMEAYRQWRDWAQKAVADYSFHVAITWWDESVREDMGTLVREHGVNSFKHFMAYKNAIMCDDETLVNSFSTALTLGAIVTVHAENGDLVFKLQDEIYKRGITGPEGHPLSRPPEVEGEAANRAIRIAEVLKVPIYVVHVSSRQALEAITRARNEGQRVFGEVLAGHLLIDDSVYRDPDFDARRGPRDEPALPLAGAPGRAVARPAVRQPADHRHGSLHVLRGAEGRGQGRLPQDPERHGRHREPHGSAVASRREHRAADHERVRARHLHQRGADLQHLSAQGQRRRSAPMPTSWSGIRRRPRPSPRRRITRTIDFNIFEGMTVKGCASHTVSGGKLVYANGDLRVERGAGRHVDRPPFAPYYDAVRKQIELSTPQPVRR